MLQMVIRALLYINAIGHRMQDAASYTLMLSSRTAARRGEFIQELIQVQVEPPWIFNRQGVADPRNGDKLSLRQPLVQLKAEAARGDDVVLTCPGEHGGSGKLQP